MTFENLQHVFAFQIPDSNTKCKPEEDSFLAQDRNNEITGEWHLVAWVVNKIFLWIYVVAFVLLLIFSSA